MTKQLGLIFLLTFSVYAAVDEKILDVKKGSSRVEFTATGTSQLTIKGKTKEENPVDGKLVLKGQNLTGTAQLSLAGLDTGMGLRNRHMKEKYLEVEKYPQAELTLTELVLPKPVSGDFSAEKVPFKGDLLLHGQKKPVTGMVNVTKKNSEFEFEFNFALKMGEFGIATPSFMGVTVAEEVNVLVHAKSQLAQN